MHGGFGLQCGAGARPHAGRRARPRWRRSTSAGGPFASYVIVAPAADGSPLLLLSRLAVHTQEPRARSARLAALRARAGGRRGVDDGAPPDADRPRPARGRARIRAQRFLARHPDAARYAGFADFSLYRFHIEARSPRGGLRPHRLAHPGRASRACRAAPPETCDLVRIGASGYGSPLARAELASSEGIHRGDRDHVSI